MVEWEERKLGSVCTKVLTGGTPLTKIPEYYANGTIPWLKTKEVNFCRIDKTEYFISEQGLANSAAKLVPTNSVIVAMYGQGDTAGRVAINKIPLTTNQACCNLVIDDTVADYQFIYYLLKNSYSELVQRKTGSAQPNLNTKLIKGFDILLPSFPEQKAITAVLSSLDDKIDLLHRQNKTLESLAQTLFRHWFIDEAEGFVKLTDLVEINPSLSMKKGTTAPYLEMKNVRTDSCAPIDWYGRDYKSGSRFQNGDTLMARITPCLENNKVSFVNFLEGNEIGWGSTEFLVLRAKGDLPKFYTYVLAKDSDFRSFAIKSMTGSSGRQRVQTKSLYNYELGVPIEENLETFTSQVSVIEKRLKLNATQIRTMEELRDTLLPKLMSGEVRVQI